MRIFFLHTLSICLIFLGCSSKNDHDVAGGWMDETETVVAGRVVTPTGEPIPLAMVTLHHYFQSGTTTTNVDSLRSISTVSNDSGNYSFAAVDTGVWYLETSFGDQGSLRKLHLDGTDTSLFLFDDTLSQLAHISIAVPAGYADATLFIPELNRLIPVVGMDSISLDIPTSSYTVIWIPETVKIPTATGETILVENHLSSYTASNSSTTMSSSTALSSSSSSSSTALPVLWTLLATWNFSNAADPWADIVNSSQPAVVIAGTPSLLTGLLSLDGASGLKAPLLGSEKVQEFQLDVSFKPTAGVLGVQNLFCSEASSSTSASWCLRIHPSGLLSFAYAEPNLAADSVTTLISWDVMQVVRIRSMKTGITMLIDSAPTATKSTPVDLSALTADFSIGCRISAGASDRFFTGLIDYISLSTPQ